MRARFDRFDAEQSVLTAESHPYLLNKSVVHAWDCGIASVRPQVDYTRTCIAMPQLDGMGSLDDLLQCAWEPTMIARRLTSGRLTIYSRSRRLRVGPSEQGRGRNEACH